ncbi:MAG: phosphoribosylformylglycinamidine cyclo-ligase [Nitrospirae bacterium]|nr:phosphoribosylformylglycinamidine cyclo-ligase [Nitrospirota bacterium]
MSKLDYKSAGVDIDAGDRLVEMIKPLVRSTFRKEVAGDIGGFGGLFRFDPKKYKDPILVSGTDGVGTKLKIAFMMDKHDTVGIDLVAMSVNDIVVQGAEPLFFLDYFATGKLQVEKARDVIKGIADGCRQAGCALIGGETAEMPSFYPEGEYDIAGFAVGVVDRERLIDGSRIIHGDKIIGLASTGLHSNGYSLARKVFFEHLKLKVDSFIDEFGCTVGEELLKPTRIYVKTILELMKVFDLKGIAHITGGGITENLPRVLSEGCQANIKRGSWNVLPVFKYLQKNGNIDDDEMYRDFNMGIGMILVVPDKEFDKVMANAERLGEKVYLIGEIAEGENRVIYV